jgi:sugar-specific transcriptional regulator TrmB
MGMTRPEAVVYTVLLSLGPSPARKLHAPAHHSREDVYRILRSLEAKGFVEAHMEKPMTFVAIEPEAAVQAFSARIEDESRARMKKAQELGTWLDEIRGAAVEEEASCQNYHVKLLHGPQVIKAVNSMIRKSEREYLLVTTAAWLPRMDVVGNLEPLIAASRRGVKVRIITEVTAENFDFIRKCRRVFEIRHHNGASQTVRMALSDDSEVLFALSAKDEVVERMLSLTSDSAPAIEGFKFIFETLWTVSVPATEVILA